jgi:hypothetical protein
VATLHHTLDSDTADVDETDQRRIYRWYRVLRRVEQRMDASGDTARLERIRKELERGGDEIRATHVPARYGADLFALRLHHRLLCDRFESLEARGHDRDSGTI